MKAGKMIYVTEDISNHCSYQILVVPYSFENLALSGEVILDLLID